MWCQSTACLEQSPQSAALNHKVVYPWRAERLRDFHVNTKARLWKKNKDGKDGYINNAVLRFLNTWTIRNSGLQFKSNSSAVSCSTYTPKTYFTKEKKHGSTHLSCKNISKKAFCWVGVWVGNHAEHLMMSPLQQDKTRIRLEYFAVV